MEKPPTVALLDHLADLPDPRIARHRWPKALSGKSNTVV